MSIVSLRQQIKDLREAVTRHPLFRRQWSVVDLRIVMEHHVIAVWDFMSLAKTLQRGLTCVEVPWSPPVYARAARMINEIILAEESDCIASLGFYGSHFELYMAAMEEVGADVSPIKNFLESVGSGVSFAQALESSQLPISAQRFARHTIGVCQRPLHEVASSFLFGREDVIPDMFKRMLPILPERECRHFRGYLDRHIHLDHDQHGPMAESVLQNLCDRGESSQHWREAAEAAAESLASRRALWDDILQSLEQVSPRSLRV
jgi:hypothetical protein